MKLPLRENKRGKQLSQNNTINQIEAEVQYCSFAKPSRLSGKFEVTGIRLTEEQVKLFQSLGVQVNFDTKNPSDSPDNRGFYKSMKSESPVRLTDMEGNELPDSLFIGNGSRLIMAFRVKDWVHKETGKSGKSVVWLGGKVKEFVKYDPDEANRKKAEQLLDGVSGEGFVFGEDSAESSKSELGEFLDSERA